MIWVHSYKIGKKFLTIVHHDKDEAMKSLQVLGGEVRTYVEVGEEEE